MTRVGIIGLGYVGLPLAVEFVRAGAHVTGVDVDPRKAQAIAAHRTYIEDISDADLAEVDATGRFVATTDASALDDRDAIIICLPTPLDEHRNPDLSYVLAGAETAAAHLAPGAPVKGADILLLGMAYKANVGDLRESPSLKLVELLRKDGADVEYHDPHVAHVNGLEMDSVPLTAERIAAADCVVIATNHKAVDLGPVVAGAKLVVDLRNAVRTSLSGAPAGPVPDNVDVL